MAQDSTRDWWRTLAAEFLDVPAFRDRRWRHVQSVGAQAELVAPALGEEGQLLIAAAWLHDIGYAPEIHRTGFHPIDGADELVRRGSLARWHCATGTR